MALKHYREKRTKPLADTDIKRDTPHQLAVEQLVPRIVNKSRNAVKVDRTEFYFYQRKVSGRRCSCFSIEQAPSGDCLVCYGVGFVGAYDKYGCETEVLDVTRPDVRMFNVELNYVQRTRPVLFRLLAGATYGFVEFDVSPYSNVRLVDHLQVFSSVSDYRRSGVSTSVTYAGRTEKLTEKSVSSALGEATFTVRVEFRRNTTSVPTPYLSHVMLRYRKLEKVSVYGDIPRRRRSVILQEFGYSDNYEFINIFLADEPRVVSTEDLFIHCREGTRWKVTDASENRPADILTSHDVTVRLVSSHESYVNVPM